MFKKKVKKTVQLNARKNTVVSKKWFEKTVQLNRKKPSFIKNNPRKRKKSPLTAKSSSAPCDVKKNIVLFEEKDL